MAKQVIGFGRGSGFYDDDGEVDEAKVREFVGELLGRTTIEPEQPSERTRPIDVEARDAWIARIPDRVKEALRESMENPKQLSPEEHEQIDRNAYGRAIARQMARRSRAADTDDNPLKAIGRILKPPTNES